MTSEQVRELPASVVSPACFTDVPAPPWLVTMRITDWLEMYERANTEP